METLKKLTEQDILELLYEYKSELRILNFRVEDIRSKINYLEQILRTGEYATGIDEEGISLDEKYLEKGEDTIGRPGRLKRNFPLSEWDKLIIDSLQESGKAMINQEIYDAIVGKLKERDLFRDETKAKAKLNQCLVKLANRRGDLLKVRFEGRGFAYVLPEWMEGNRLKREYSRE